MLRFLTAGESHGRALVVIVEGVPAGLPLTVEEVQGELARRRLGYGRGPRMRFEADEITLRRRDPSRPHPRLAGRNRDREHRMAEVGRGDVTASGCSEQDPHRTATRTCRPRGNAEVRLRRRPRRPRAGLGAGDRGAGLRRVASLRRCCRIWGSSCLSHVVALGDVFSPMQVPGPLDTDLAIVDASPVRCFDAVAEARMVAAIKAAAKDGDSLGGVVEVLAYGVPVGLGSHVHWDRKLDGLLAQAFMSIQAVKAVEIGEGSEMSTRRGSEAHDSIEWDEENEHISRGRPHEPAGSKAGSPMAASSSRRLSMKPLATLNRPVLGTVDVVTKETKLSFKERTDVTAVPAMGVVAESMLATRSRR